VTQSSQEFVFLAVLNSMERLYRCLAMEFWLLTLLINQKFIDFKSRNKKYVLRKPIK